MISQQKWLSFSTAEQFGNIGSEIARAKNFQNKGDVEQMNRSIFRALELIDLTVEDHRLSGRLKELLRYRELLCDIYCGTHYFNVSLENLENYCLPFALRARWNR